MELKKQLIISEKMSKLFKKIAIIIPFYNEEKYLLNFIKTFEKISSFDDDFYFFFIDDGSTDNSASLIEEISKNKTKINLIKLKNNYGKDIAISYALKTLDNFDYYITLDSDGQHDIKYIKEMTKNLKVYNHDSILTIREKYQMKINLKFYLRKFFFFLIKSKFKNINPLVSDYMAFNKSIRDNVISFNTPVFLRFLVQFLSVNSKIIPIDIVNIKKKNSKFGLINSFKLALKVFAFYGLIPTRSIIYSSFVLFLFLIINFIIQSSIFFFMILFLFLAIIIFYLFYIFYISFLSFNNIRNTVSSSLKIGNFFND